MLMVTAGADVYATSNTGESVSDFAKITGHLEEWVEVLEECGFDKKSGVESRSAI